MDDLQLLPVNVEFCSMHPKLIVTDDGSHTLEGKGGITYHSRFGALQESQHIFIGGPPGKREFLRAKVR